MAEVIDVLLRARMEASGVEAGVGQIQKSLQGLTLPKGVTNDLEKSFSKLTPLLKEYQKQLNKGFSNKKDLQNFNTLRQKIDETFGEIRSQIQSVNSQNIKLKVDVHEIDALNNKITAKTSELQKAINNAFTKTVNTSSIQEQLDKVFKSTTRASSIKPMGDAAKRLFNTQEFTAYNNKIDEIKNKILSLSSTKTNFAEKVLNFKDASKDIDAVNNKIKKFFDDLKVNEGKAANIERLKGELRALGVELENIEKSSLTRGTAEFEGINTMIDQLNGSLRETGSAADDAGQGMVRMVDQVNELKTSTQYFFSLRNMINLLKKGVDDAVKSVKELDAAMTETAVVTDFKVSDMWNMLPEYTRVANELGATTQGAYETMTLYYQQGLDQQQAFEIGTETMKMARIAGLEYKDATDMMTAALRGFNMELDKTSAKRINDVYSELAAITASDTEELGSAMQRTASIAASAGASFEGTTAFLAQAIETTREPAENIGTAMKTIIARFQEMKKNPLEISEVDGEEVDFNKIDAALKTIGVDLVDTNGQFRDFDKVMLDISAKWDTLSQSQQRYIATTAAGSRQQSRFIAMVSNYDRTMQLMEAANNSAGASEEQFGKTVESLEFKLNKLHNAWERFTMGIANNNFIKGVVDSGTLVLDTVDKVMNKLTGFDDTGFSKSILSIATAFMGLKVGGRAVNSLIGGLGGLVDPTSSVREGLQIGFLGGRANQTDKIVNAINGLIPHIDGTKNNDTGSLRDQDGYYKGARWDLAKLMGGAGVGFGKNNGKYTISDIQDIFNNNGLSKSQQKTFFQSSPGLKHNLVNSLSQMMREVGMEPEVSRGLIKGFKQGKLSLDEVLSHNAFNENHLEKTARLAKDQGQQIANEYKQGIVKELIKKGKAQGITDSKELGKFVSQGLQKRAIDDIATKTQQLTPFEKAGDAIGRTGAALNQVGMSLQMVGSQLSVVNPALGNMVTELGGVMTAAGSFVNIIPSFMAMGPVAVAAAAAIGGLSFAFLKYKNHIANIKKSAEEVSDSFNKTNKSVQENISTLKAYRNELATLAKGVDINGNNVNLSDSDYETYLQIVDEIASINPSIVKGYNAQGHAIIDNNTALSDTLKLQEQIQKQTIKQYTSEASLQKLIDARNIDTNFKKGLGVQSTADYTKMHKTFRGDMLASPETLVNAQVASKVRAPMTQNINNILTQLKSQDGLELEQILQNFNIALTDLENGETYAVNRFLRNQDAINGAIGDSVIASRKELKESITKSFDDLKEISTAFDESIEPAYQSLQAYASNLPTFKNIAPEFQSSIMTGLKDIVIQPDLDATAMQEQARILIQGFDNLTAEGSDYAEAMKDVTEAQNDFAESLDADEYVDKTSDALETLNSLMQEYAGKSDAYSQSIADYLQTQMDKIKDFTKDGATSLGEALNEVSDSIAAAEGAYDTFKETTKTDFSTGAENMKSIYDEVTKETDGVRLHMEKKGDKTMWAGAEALLGKDFVEKNAGNVDKIKSAITSLGSELKDGEEGFRAFWQNFKQVSDENINGFTWNEDGSYTMDETVNPDVYKQVADEMGRAEEYLTAMLNKGRQYGDIDFINRKDMRTALATDEATITNGKKIFVKKDYLDNALNEAGYVNPNDRKQRKEELQKDNNIIEIKDADAIKKKDFDSMGITSLPNLIKTLGDTGQFNRDEILQYAKALDKVSDDLSFDSDEITGAYDKYIKDQEHPELKPIEDINSTVKQIANLIDINRITEGNFTEKDAEAAETAYRSAVGYEEGADTQVQYFGEGKDQYGNSLSAKEYKDTYNELLEGANNFDEKAKLYRKAASNLEKGSDEQKQALEFAEKYETAAKVYRANIKEGEKAYVENKAQAAYDKKLKELQNSGLSDDQIKGEAAEARDIAMKKAQKYVDEIKAGLIDGINESTDSSKLRENKKSKKDESKTESEKSTPPEVGSTTQKEQSPSREKLRGTDELTWRDKVPGLVSILITALNKYNTPETTTIPGVGPVNSAGKPVKNTLSDPIYSEEQTELYSRGTEKIREGLQKFWQGFKDGLSSDQGTEDPEAIASSYAQNNSKIKEFFNELYLKAGKAFDEAAKNGALGGYVGGAMPNNITESIRSRMSQIWDNIKKAFSFSNKEMGPKIDASTITRPISQALKSVWSSIKKALTPPKFNLEPKGTNVNKGEGSQTNAKVDSKVDVTAEAEVTNKDEVKASVEKQLQSALKTAAAEAKLQAKASVTVDTKLGKQVKAKKQTATVDYKKGKQDKAEKQSTTVDYTLGKQAPPKPKSTTVNYTLGSQADPKPKTVDISPHFVGSWTKTITLTPSKAKGMNNKIPKTSLPQFGSLAKGTPYGRLGPKGKGGLTLTGEEGFEIAWLPDESRSMILGVDGPQMINLPSNAVVYTHEQSKDIIKRKSIPLGSLGKGSYDDGSSSNKSTRNSGGRSSKGSGSGSNKTAKRNEENSKKTKKIIEKAGKINAWWWNMTKKVEATQRKIDKGAKKVSEILKKVGKTISVVKETVNDYAKNLRTQIQLNTRMSNKANKKLETLDTAKKSSATKKAETAVSKAQKKLNKAKNKKDKKEAKKQLTKAKNKLRKTQKGVNYSTISYDVTQVEKDKKGKKKKSKKTKKQRINLAPFIKYDEETGAYVIDYNKINKKYGKNKSKAKAVMEAAEKKLEDYQGKKNTAEDNIEKANEALNQLGQDLYDAIYGWEVELTKIWNITQQIEETTGHIERLTSFIDLMDAQVASGMAEVNADFIKEYTDTFRNKLKADIQKLEQQMQLIDFGKIELQDLLDVNTNADAISNIGAINKATEDQIEQVNETKNKYESKKDTAAAKKATKEAAYKELQDAKAKLDKLKNAKKKDKKAIAAAQKEVEKKRAAYNKTKDPYTTAAKEKEEAEKNYNTATETWKEGIEAGTLFDDYDYALNSKYVEELKADQMARQLAQGLTKITTNDDGTVSVDFNADEFLRARKNGKFDDGTVLNGETANRIQEYVKSIADKVNELNNAYVEATNLIAEQYQQLAELKDNWANYGEQLLSYVEEQQSEKIDELKALADSIDKSLKDLLDKVRQDLDRRRQQEDNAKTERNISKKQQRLATLRSNTGGGNQVEIARLQEEIAEEQMNYQRTLEDQLLERLNDQADLAAKQRERQIQLEEAILQATNNAALVNKWMDDPERYKDEIQAAFYDNNKYNELTAAQQAKLEDEFNELYTGLLTNHDKQEAVKEAIAENEKWLIKIKESLSDLAKALNQTPTTPTEDEGDDDDRDNDDDNPDPTPNTPNMANWENSVRYYASQKHYQDRAKTSELFSWGSNHYGLTAGQIMQAIADTSQATWEDAINAARKLYSDDKVKQILMDLWGTNITNARKKGWEAVFGKIYASTGTAAFMKRYASGGIATQTGPAWLDGTPAKPELVLSPTDTKNFIALKDVLSHVMGSTNSLSNVYSGDASYEININVDHINSDYDVDKIAARIEKKIVSSANYRNVTQVRKFR